MSAAAAPRKAWTLVLASLGVLLPKWIGRSVLAAAGVSADMTTTTKGEPKWGRLDRIRLLPARANGQPTLAAYAEDETTGTYDAYGVMVVAIDGDSIVGITGSPRRPELFERLGFPVALTG